MGAGVSLHWMAPAMTRSERLLTVGLSFLFTFAALWLLTAAVDPTPLGKVFQAALGGVCIAHTIRWIYGQ